MKMEWIEYLKASKNKEASMIGEQLEKEIR